MTDRVIALPPDEATYTLRSAHVPVCCLERLRPEDLEGLQPCVDGLALVDITVNGSKILSITPAGAAARDELPNGHAAAHQALPVPHVDLRGKMVLPTFVDLHTHIGATSTWMQQCHAHLHDRDRVEPGVPFNPWLAVLGGRVESWRGVCGSLLDRHPLPLAIIPPSLFCPLLHPPPSQTRATRASAAATRTAP